MDDLQLRDLHTDDYPAAAALWAATPGLAPTDPPEQLRRFLVRNAAYCSSAWDGERLVGVLLGSFDGVRGYLHRLAVDAAWQRRGVASRLVERSLAALRADGAVRCLAMVLEDNATAVDFWGAKQWQHLGLIHLFGKRLDAEGPLR